MSELAPVASRLADPARARILEELLGGVPLPVGALAARAGIAPPTASGWLRRGTDGRALDVTPDGATALERAGVGL